MNELAGVEITLRGLVQGVGFRYFIHRNALNLKLTGYVKNLPDGSVFIVAEGEKNVIEGFVDIAVMGPSKSNVREKKIKFTSYSGFYKVFNILR